MWGLRANQLKWFCHINNTLTMPLLIYLHNRMGNVSDVANMRVVLLTKGGFKLPLRSCYTIICYLPSIRITA